MSKQVNYERQDLATSGTNKKLLEQTRQSLWLPPYSRHTMHLNTHTPPSVCTLASQQHHQSYSNLHHNCCTYVIIFTCSSTMFLLLLEEWELFTETFDFLSAADVDPSCLTPFLTSTWGLDAVDKQLSVEDDEVTGRRPRISLTTFGSFLYSFSCRKMPSALHRVSSKGIEKLMSLICWGKKELWMTGVGLKVSGGTGNNKGSLSYSELPIFLLL